MMGQEVPDAWRWHFGGVAFLLAAPVLSISRTPHEAHFKGERKKEHVHIRTDMLASCWKMKSMNTRSYSWNGYTLSKVIDS